MKNIVYALVILLLGAAIWYWSDKRSDARDREAAAYVIQLEELRAIVRQDSLELAANKQELADVTQAADSTIADLRAQSEAERIESAKQYGELRDTLTDTQKVMLDNLRRLWDRQLAAEQAIVVEQAKIIASQRLLIVKFDSTVVHLRSENATEKQLTAYWKDEANPSFLEDLGIHAPRYALFAGGVVVLTYVLVTIAG